MVTKCFNLSNLCICKPVHSSADALCSLHRNVRYTSVTAGSSKLLFKELTGCILGTNYRGWVWASAYEKELPVLPGKFLGVGLKMVSDSKPVGKK